MAQLSPILTNQSTIGLIHLDRVMRISVVVATRRADVKAAMPRAICLVAAARWEVFLAVVCVSRCATDNRSGHTDALLVTPPWPETTRFL